MKLSEIKTGDQLQMELVKQGWLKSAGYFNPADSDFPFFSFDDSSEETTSIKLYPVAPQKLTKFLEELGWGTDVWIGAQLDLRDVIDCWFCESLCHGECHDIDDPEAVELKHEALLNYLIRRFPQFEREYQ